MPGRIQETWKGLGAFREGRSDWVRVRTLIALRWAAIAGQTAAIAVASTFYGIDLDVALSLSVVAAAVVFNLACMLIFPRNRRMSELGATLSFLFDTGQLALLLALTGGLTNPFALLILAPATIAATALRPTSSVVVGATTVALVTVVALVHRPLRLPDGTTLMAPPILEFGFWTSIVTGVIFLSLYAQRVAGEIHTMGEALLATQMALGREQKLTDLGGVVAAAAHELGTPLATIKLVSTELAELLSDDADLRQDAELIRAQADRCRDILRAMGQSGTDGSHLRSAPLSAIVREAAEPHSGRGKALVIAIPATSADGMRQPVLDRRPEIIHGLRNLIQNAVDHAAASVWVDADWADGQVRVTIADDGPGFAPDMIGRIGDPFLRGRALEARHERTGYEGMGLGLFIAKTLLERTGAELTFANGSDPFLRDTERPPDRSGAVVEVAWPLAAISAAEGQARPVSSADDRGISRDAPLRKN
jgi:two-component system sensor histidine kinase RegB